MLRPTSLFLTACCIFGCLVFTSFSFAQEKDDSWRNVAEPQTPKIAPASNEGELAIQGFKIPEGWTAKLFAAEPDVANPVAFDVDFQNRVFVVESFRQEKGIEDNRSHRHWLIDDLAALTIEDRLAYIKKHLKEKAVDYTKHDDRIRLLRDTNGDGKANQSTVFSKGYNTILSGSGAGVLSYRGNVYFTCIPDLFMLRDLNNDDVADAQLLMSSGYGVRFAFRGHDLHGLIIGPDGRLYFSIGDRGYNVSLPEETRSGLNLPGSHALTDPASGAVFRCELDGSNLEVVATGLRNPQELAFDDYGNLFTGDNNSDSGDKARWVYVVQGGDSGWRMYYQYLPDRGPFNREKIWHPYHAETPAYIVPPVTNLADGPSGLAFYPGTGLSKHYDQRFFLCDFRGQSNSSGVRSFRVKPKGAFFEVADMEQTLWKQLVTDIQFGPDGKIYTSDWVHGWQGLGKGRIYTFTDSKADQTLIAEVSKMLKEGFKKTDSAQLDNLLGHRDRRIRQEAQFELALRNEPTRLLNVAKDSKRTILARLHSLWGLEQILRKNEKALKNKANAFTAEPADSLDAELRESLRSLAKNLIESEHAEIRAQAMRLLWENSIANSNDLIAKGLDDKNGRVKQFAMRAMGRSQSTLHLPKLLKVIVENQDQDPILRHAAVMAFYDSNRIAGLRVENISGQPRISLTDAGNHESPMVRKIAVVALRKLAVSNGTIVARHENLSRAFLQKPEHEILAKLLNDNDLTVATEACRAVYDTEYQAGFPVLAAKLGESGLPDEIIRRSIAANFRLGKSENAQRLAKFAADSRFPVERRVEAIDLLGQWHRERQLDSVTGKYWPIEKRDADFAKQAINQNLTQLLKGPVPLVQKCVQVCGALKIANIKQYLIKIVNDANADINLRSNSIYGLHQIGKCSAEILNSAASAKEPQLRATALDILVRTKSPAASPLFAELSRNAPLPEKQKAWRLAGKMTDENSAKAIEAALSELQSVLDQKNDVEIESIALDVIAAARIRKEKPVKDQLGALRRKLNRQGLPIDRHRFSKTGGDWKKGQKIFFERTDVSCLRCHKVGLSGGDVGPLLTEIGKEKTTEYLLESIVDPNKTIAEKFESVVVLDLDGESHTGIIKKETDDYIELMDDQGNSKRIKNDDIDDVQKTISAMPEDIAKKLSAEEIRDVIAFLRQLKGQDKGKRYGHEGHGQ